MIRTILLLLISIALAHAEVDLSQIASNYCDTNMPNMLAPGAIVGVIDDGTIAFSRTKGHRNIEKNLPVNSKTLFRIGSLTKTFTATAIMILRDRGELKLDDLVENYIEELTEIKYPYPNSPRITIRHLVTHSSGLLRHPEPSDQSIEGLIEEVLNPAATDSIFVQRSEENSYLYPGYHYLYSNIAIALLGEVVTRVSGEKVKDFIKQEILTPLKMNNTYWHESEIPESIRSYPYQWNSESKKWERKIDWNLQGYSAAGSIYSNLEDLAKWMKFQFETDVRSPTYQILSPFTLQEMHRIQILEGSDRNRGTGIIWYTNIVDNFQQTGHNGATYNYITYFGFDKKRKVGVVALASNVDANTPDFGSELLATIQKAFAKDDSLIFHDIANKLLPYLQLKTIDKLRDIFDQDMYDYAGDQWADTFKYLSDKYGVVESIIEILGSNKTTANVKLKTSKGTLTYQITFSSREEGKLSGLLVVDATADK